MMDLGSVHERTTAMFTVWLAQYTPSALHGDEDRISVSRLQVRPLLPRLDLRPGALGFRVQDCDLKYECEFAAHACVPP